MWFLIVTLFPNIGPAGVLTGHIVCIVLYTVLFLTFYKVKFPEYFKYLFLISLLFAATIVISLLANYYHFDFGIIQLRYAFVPFYWTFALLAGVVDAKIFGGKRDLFFYMAAAFILIQIPIILMQTFGMNDILWSSGKAGSYTGIFRVVGTVQNPNSLGIITVFCIIIFTYYYKEKPFWSKVFIGLCVLIVFATGSRTALIVLILLPVAFITKEKLFSRKIIYVIVGVFLILTLFYLVLLQLKETLPYMSQILNLVQFKSVHTLNTRFAHWRHVKHLYSLASLKVKLFGFGPGYFNVLDNSYLYVLYNYGIIAVVSFFVLLFMLFRTSVKTRVKLAQRSLFILLICGLVADVMLNFLLMSIIFYFIGMQAYTGLQENALEPAINNIKR